MVSTEAMKQNNLTKKQFEQLLKKAAQPVKRFDSKGIQTSESRPSDGYNDKRKNQDKTEGKED